MLGVVRLPLFCVARQYGSLSKKSKHGNVSSKTYKICDLLYENRTYQAKSNFENGAKVNFVLNMAS